MLLITTSHRPSGKTRRFCNSLKVFPYSFRRNRGSLSLTDLLEMTFGDGFTRVIIVTTRNGNPAELIFYQDKQLVPFKFVILSVKMDETRIAFSKIPTFTTVEFLIHDDLQVTDIVHQLTNYFNFTPDSEKLSLLKPHFTPSPRSLIIDLQKDEAGVKISFIDKKTTTQHLPLIKGYFAVSKD